MTNARIVSETCIMQGLRAATRAVTQAYEEALRPVDLTASQFTTLVALMRQDGIPVSKLAERLSMDRTTMTRVLAPLERRGLLRLDVAEADQRSRRVVLVAEGRALVEAALPHWSRAQDRALALLGEGAVAEMREQLRGLREI